MNSARHWMLIGCCFAMATTSLQAQTDPRSPLGGLPNPSGNKSSDVDQGRVPLGSLTLEQTRSLAVKILVDASAGESPALRSNAIEALKLDPAMALPIAQRLLRDQNPGVRFAAVVVTGSNRYGALAPLVRERLTDPDGSVRAAALYTMRRLNQPVDLTPLAQMLASDDLRLRANVAVVLGMVGDESAIPMLQEAVRAPMPKAGADEAALVRIQYAEALAMIGDNSALDGLRAGVYSQFGDVRILAINALGAVGDRRMEGALVNLLKDPGNAVPPESPEELKLQAELAGKITRLAAAGALARVRNEAGREVPIRYALDPDPVIRHQTSWVLGWFSDDQTFVVLRRMLVDQDPRVRVSAAASVLRRAVDRQTPAGSGVPK